MPIHTVSGKINMMPSTNRLSEESQLTKMWYALVNNKIGMIHEFVLCKDFLTDAVAAHLNSKKISVYGFKYEPTKDNCPHFDRTMILLRFKAETNLNNFYQSLSRLETTCCLGNIVSPTRAFIMSSMATKDYSYLLVSSDGIWMKSPVLLSLYTLLLRLSNHPIGTDIGDIMSYLSSILGKYTVEGKVLPKEIMQGITVVPYMHKVFTNRCKLFGNIIEENTFDKNYYPQYIDTHWHNTCGIVSLLKGSNANISKVELNSILEIVPKPGKIKNMLIEDDVKFKQWYDFLTNCNVLQIMGFVRKEGKSRIVVTPPINSITDLFIAWSKVLKDDKTKVDKTMLRLLFSADYMKINRYKERMFLAKNIINVYESVMGIEKKTVISSTEIKGIDKGSSETFLMTSSNVWLGSPTLLHLYLSTIRMIVLTKQNTSQINAPKTLDGAIKLLTDLVSKCSLSMVERPFVHLIEFILKNHKDLLKIDPAEEFPTTFSVFNKKFAEFNRLPTVMDTEKSKYALTKLKHWGELNQ